MSERKLHRPAKEYLENSGGYGNSKRGALKGAIFSYKQPPELSGFPHGSPRRMGENFRTYAEISEITAAQPAAYGLHDAFSVFS